MVGSGVACIIGGNTEPIVDALVETGTGYVCCPAATDQKAFLEKMRAHPEVMVWINMHPGPLLSKNPAVIEIEVDRVLGLAQNRPHVGGTPNAKNRVWEGLPQATYRLWGPEPGIGTGA